MTVKFTENLFSNTYKDDFADSNNYHRILFNSGRALQARELTQMQSIIQKEIATFGRNIFKEGANVLPSGVTLNTRYEFIKLDTSTNALPANTASMIGAEFEGDDSGIKVIILEVVPATATDPATLYVRYTDTTGGASGAAPIRMTAGEDMIAGAIGVTLTVQTTNTTNNPAVGVGSKISVDKGSFFTQGHFVFVAKQSQIIGKYTSLPTTVVGFRVDQDIVTADDTESLFDNQGSTPNRSAPGADRYRISLKLIEQQNVDSDENFVYFCRVINGNVFDVVQGNDQYAAIEDRMALRTNELHGDFIINPFLLNYEADSEDTHLVAVLSPGLAYVNGYRVNRDYATRIRVPRAQETATINNEVSAASYGNYIDVVDLKGLPNINVFQQRNLRDAVDFGGSTIGTCRIRAIESMPGNEYRLYIFDVVMNDGQIFGDVKSIGGSILDYANLQLENSQGVLKDVSNNNLLFGLPRTRPKLLSDISLEVQRRFNASLDPSGAATLTLTGTGETFANTNDWLVAVDSNGSLIQGDVSISGAGTQSASITGGPTNTNIEIIAKVNKGSGSVRTKTLVEATVAGVVESDGSGTKFLALNKPDLFKLDRLRDSDSDGDNRLQDFIVDNGQRDNWYGPARLILKGDKQAPSGDLFARFRYFTHGASGDFFSANSYAGQVPYGQIPTHTLKDGNTVDLRDVLDFRPRKTDRDSDFTGGTARINELPETTDLITADIDYYLPRYDRYVVDQDGNLKAKLGRSDFDPKFPSISTNELNIVNVKMDAFTIDDSDIETQVLDTKKYSMSDIGAMEQKLDDLYELTTLSLLETNLSNLDVLDSIGNDRTKSGFLVDNFQDQQATSFDNVEYRASIDPQNKLLRPAFTEEAVRLFYDSDLSTNTILKGDNIYMKYDEVGYIDQLQVSGTMNINPFNVITNIGVLELSPASDEWRETRYTGARTVSGGTVNSFSGNQATLFNSSQWNWAGTQVGAARTQGLGSSSSTSSQSFVGQGSAGNWRATAVRTVSSTVTTTRTAVARVASFSTIRRVVGDRVVDVALIPFMRTRRVSFKAEGLKPNTRVWPFFDGTDVSNWVRSDTFTRVAVTNEELGNRFDRATGHPEGATTLFTDDEGKVEGNFIIPNTNTLRFRTGTREFKLLDISSNDEESATSIGIAAFVSSGVLETRQQTIQSTRVRNVVTGTSSSSRTTGRSSSLSTTSWNVATGERRVNGVQVVPPRTVRQVDPLAQSFFIPDQDGVFLTKVDIFFQTKDDTIPVQLQLRPMVNGHPSSDDIIPGSIVFKSPNGITTSSDASAATSFVFEEPVYLLPYQEYAVVLIAETDNYNVYVAEGGEFILNSTEKRITSQPSLGSLFKSQNTSTWTADQTRDMMFKLYRADFRSNTVSTATLRNASVPRRLLPEDPIKTQAGSFNLTVNHPDHGFIAGDNVSIVGLDSDLTYGSLKGTSFMGTRAIISTDNDFFVIPGDSNAPTDTVVGGFAVQSTQNIPFEEVWPYLETNLPQSTSIAAEGKFVSGKSTAGTEVQYTQDNTFFPLSLKARNQFLTPRVLMNDDIETAELPVGEKSATIQVDVQSSSSYVSPVIDMQRASLWLTHNRIDNQAASAATNFNVPLTYVAETDKTGGTSLSKHITRAVTLQTKAVGLKLILAANRPAEADFKVYYKAINDDELFDETNWTEVVRQVNLPTDDNPDIFRDYEYLVGGENGLSVPFTRFILKIVMSSYNNSKVPVFKDLRVIALAI